VADWRNKAIAPYKCPAVRNRSFASSVAAAWLRRSPRGGLLLPDCIFNGPPA
jgi:hypothetical protein